MAATASACRTRSWERVRTCPPGGADTMTTPTRTSTNTAPMADGPRTSPPARACGPCSTARRGRRGCLVHDPVARDLMEFAADKYRALARKHKLDTWEAVTAAFDAMQNRSTREANDPWAIITHAVRITCVYEERAQGCSARCTRPAAPTSRRSTTPNDSPNAIPRWPTTIPRSTPPTCVPVTSNRNRATVSVGAGVHVRRIGGRDAIAMHAPARLADRHRTGRGRARLQGVDEGRHPPVRLRGASPRPARAGTARPPRRSWAAC